MTEKELKQAILEKVSKGMDYQNLLIKQLGISPRLRINVAGKVLIDVGQAGQKVVHKICKLIDVHLDKTVTSQGFLKYVGFKDGIQITINSKECFYGGTPIVTTHPRSTAHCPIRTKKGDGNDLAL